MLRALSWFYTFITVWYVFFFNDTATTEIYTLSLHDALPISLIHGRIGDVPLNQLAGSKSGCRFSRCIIGHPRQFPRLEPAAHPQFRGSDVVPVFAQDAGVRNRSASRRPAHTAEAAGQH